jgi:FMN-dependent NADH-azoreductase
MGLTLSREESVYIQDGLYKGKKVRVVSSEKGDASNATNLFEEVGNFLTADLHILYLTDVTEVGNKRFVFYDKKSKVIISNTRNLNNIEKALAEL